MDNIINVHKILRHLKKDKSNNHQMTIKIDMSEVYDKVEWDMIISMLVEWVSIKCGKIRLENVCPRSYIVSLLMAPLALRLSPLGVSDKKIHCPLSFSSYVWKVLQRV